MSHRRVALVLSMLALFAAASDARAHKLEVTCRLRLGWKVQVEGWYEDGQPAPGARVRVARSDGQLVTEGKLNRHGVFVFPFTNADTLKVSVSTAGHRAETTISGETLTRHIVCTSVACMTLSPLTAAAVLAPMPPDDEATASAIPSTAHVSAFPIWQVLSGVGLLLGVAAFFNWKLKKRTRHNAPI
jgi:hypothetical protein